MEYFNFSSDANVNLQFKSLYSCGPTIYRLPHIGNLRNYVFSDIYCRLYNLKLYIGLTDISDQIVDIYKQGDQHKIKEYETHFLMDLQLLKIKNYVLMTVSKQVPFIINAIKKIEMRGCVEITKKEVRLRIDGKTHYALWKFTDSAQQILTYDSPWGRGRPGWHIECVANVLELEEPVLHTGGLDAKTYHHQLENIVFKLLGTPVQWSQTQLVLAGPHKMSKSLKNTVISTQVPLPKLLRYFLISADPHKPLKYSNELFNQKVIELERVISKLYCILLQDASYFSTIDNFEVFKTIEKLKIKNLHLTGTHFRKLIMLSKQSNLQNEIYFIESFLVYNEIYKLVDLNYENIKAHISLIKKYSQFKELKKYEDSDYFRNCLKNAGVELVHHHNEYVTPFIKLSNYETTRTT